MPISARRGAKRHGSTYEPDLRQVHPPRSLKSRENLVLEDARLYAFLHQVDGEMADEAHAAGCPDCGGRLHCGDFPRKPRGAKVELGAEYDRRFSFCCATDGCRHRVTPPSVRFLGRKVY